MSEPSDDLPDLRFDTEEEETCIHFTPRALSDHFAGLLQGYREHFAAHPLKSRERQEGILTGFAVAVELLRELETDGVLVAPLGDGEN